MVDGALSERWQRLADWKAFYASAKSKHPPRPVDLNTYEQSKKPHRGLPSVASMRGMFARKDSTQ
jgi:hypothetical protein